MSFKPRLRSGSIVGFRCSEEPMGRSDGLAPTLDTAMRRDRDAVL